MASQLLKMNIVSKNKYEVEDDQIWFAPTRFPNVTSNYRFFFSNNREPLKGIHQSAFALNIRIIKRKERYDNNCWPFQTPSTKRPINNHFDARPSEDCFGTSWRRLEPWHSRLTCTNLPSEGIYESQRKQFWKEHSKHASARILGERTTAATTILYWYKT